MGRKLAWEKLAEDLEFYTTHYSAGFPVIIASDVAYVMPMEISQCISQYCVACGSLSAHTGSGRRHCRTCLKWWSASSLALPPRSS